MQKSLQTSVKIGLLAYVSLALNHDQRRQHIASANKLACLISRLVRHGIIPTNQRARLNAPKDVSA